MLSIIIPTLNAEATLAATLDAISAPDNTPELADLEVIIVDGGSIDATQSIGEAHHARVVKSAPGRGRQLARGAREATADWLLFVHADTRLPKAWPDVVQRFIAVELNRERAGYFRLSFDDPSPAAKRVAALANWRAKAFGLPYGDQALLIHRGLYTDVGGHPEIDLMEDVELARRIGPMRVERLPASVVTCAEKYRRGGWWARPARNLLCLGLHLAGAPARWVEALYR